MTSQATRVGGKHVARERGALEPDDFTFIDSQGVASKVAGPLIERLSGKSLANLAEAAGCSVQEFLLQYAQESR